MDAIRVILGIVVLFIGTLVYIVDRPAEETYFVYTSGSDISLYGTLPVLFGKLGGILPAFSHVVAFILITGGVLSCKRKGCLLVAVFWFVIDCSFEIGQHFSTLAVKLIPDWLDRLPFFESSALYFQKGVFDWADLGAIFAGTLFAYWFLVKTVRKGDLK